MMCPLACDTWDFAIARQATYPNIWLLQHFLNNHARPTNSLVDVARYLDLSRDDKVKKCLLPLKCSDTKRRFPKLIQMVWIISKSCQFVHHVSVPVREYHVKSLVIVLIICCNEMKKKTILTICCHPSPSEQFVLAGERQACTLWDLWRCSVKRMVSRKRLKYCPTQNLTPTNIPNQNIATCPPMVTKTRYLNLLISANLIS